MGPGISLPTCFLVTNSQKRKCWVTIFLDYGNPSNCPQVQDECPIPTWFPQGQEVLVQTPLNSSYVCPYPASASRLRAKLSAGPGHLGKHLCLPSHGEFPGPVPVLDESADSGEGTTLPRVGAQIGKGPPPSRDRNRLSRCWNRTEGGTAAPGLQVRFGAL